MYLPGLKGGHVPLIWGSMNPVSNVVVGDTQDMVKVTFASVYCGTGAETV